MPQWHCSWNSQSPYDNEQNSIIPSFLHAHWLRPRCVLCHQGARRCSLALSLSSYLHEILDETGWKRRKALVDYSGNEDDGVLVGDGCGVSMASQKILMCFAALLTDASNGMVCEGSIWLIETQQGWIMAPGLLRSDKKQDTNSYDLLHPAWVLPSSARP